MKVKALFRLTELSQMECTEYDTENGNLTDMPKELFYFKTDELFDKPINHVIYNQIGIPELARCLIQSNALVAIWCNNQFVYIIGVGWYQVINPILDMIIKDKTECSSINWIAEDFGLTCVKPFTRSVVSYYTTLSGISISDNSMYTFHDGTWINIVDYKKSKGLPYKELLNSDYYAVYRNTKDELVFI